MKWEVSKARNERQLRREIKGDVTALPMPATPPSSAAPPAEGDLPIVTPPTSPQEHQQAGHDQECTLHQMGSPEQCRTPAVPLHPLPPPPIVVGGRALTHLPADLAALAATVPSHPTFSCQHGRGHPQQLPFPLPPPSPSCCLWIWSWFWLCCFCPWSCLCPLFYLCSPPSKRCLILYCSSF